MPITTLMTLVGALCSLGSWALITQRINQSKKSVGPQVNYLRNYFLNIGIFCVILFIPHLILTVNPASFPKTMAWGYIIGHIFFYIAALNIVRLTFSMVPRLARKEWAALAVGITAALAITIVNIQTMAYGTMPYHDFEKHVTFFNAAPAVGAGIALFATLAVLPAAILLIINGVRNPGRRLRSFLLGGGFFITMVAGPLHDVAKSWQLYMVADLVSIVGIVIITVGVLYRLEERISPAKTKTHRLAPATR